MSKAKWSSNRYVSEADKKAKKDLINLMAKVALVIMWSIVMLLIGMSAGFNLAEDDTSYKQGYHDARTLYECDHDRTECEILKDTL